MTTPDEKTRAISAESNETPSDELPAEEHHVRTMFTPAELRADPRLRQSRVISTVVIAAGVAVAALLFRPLGTWTGGIAHDIYSGSADATATLAILIFLAIDLIELVVAWAAAHFLGPRLPSGMLHAVFLVLVPISVGYAQTRFTELLGEPLAAFETFSTVNFFVLFFTVIAVVEIGNRTGLRRLIRRHVAA